jgi:hypothetical protein
VQPAALRAHFEGDMKFQFTPFGRACVPDLMFLDDLRRVARLLERRRITMAQYAKYGKYRVGTYHRFGYWCNACEMAGLGRYRFLKATAAELLADIQAVGRRLNTRCMTMSQYLEEGKYSIYWVIRFYKYGPAAVKAAGLKSPDRYRKKTAQELLQNLEVVSRTLGRQPRTVDMMPPVSTSCAAPYRREFGSWQKAVAAFVEWKSRGKKKIVKRKFMVHKTKRTANVAMRYRVLARD